MMEKQKLLTLPFPSSGIIHGPLLYTDSSDLILSMEFDDDGEKRPVKLRFVKQRAFRKRGEIYCTGWHVKDVFDTVCEIQGSEWVEELRSTAVPEWRDYWVMRHFMIYVDSFGCLEVIADSITLDDKEAKNSGGT
jgi:hypothetical protein